MPDQIFTGKWISACEFADKQPVDVRQPLCNNEHDEDLKNFHMIVRRSVRLNPEIQAKWRLRITADDYYKLYINDRFVGQGPAPGYSFAYYYNEYDIKPFLYSGENHILVHVYYQGLVNRVWNSGDYRQGLIADLLGDDEPRCVTDEQWEYAVDRSYTGHRTTGYDTQYLEDIDSRITLGSWRPCAARSHDYSFIKTPATALAVYAVTPVNFQQNGDAMLYDFGNEVTAGLRLIATGKSGQQICIRCGEELLPNGHVRWDMRCNCQYEETWTLDEGENRLEQFDYKAFRYTELLADPGVSVQSLEAVVRHYPFNNDSCVLSSSDSVLNAIFQLCKTTAKYGTQEVFVDCPSREKGQYSGDLVVSSASYLWLTGDTLLLNKAIDNQIQSLNIVPGMLAVTPGAFLQEIADYSLQFPLLVWRHYCHTGDKESLRHSVAACDQVIEYFRQYRRSDGLLENVTGKWNMVDWPENLRDNYDFPLTDPIGPGCHNVINAFYIGCIKITETIKTEAGLSFIPEATQLTETFNRCFFRPDIGLYTDSETSSHASLHANCLPVFFNLHPQENSDGLARFLTQKGLCCGVYMAYFYLKALSRLGQQETVYTLLTSTGKNSWYNMVHEGGTTCFEAWGKDKKWNTSLCHPWAGSPVSILIEDLIGLQPLPGSGYQLQPKLPSSLKFLSICLPLHNGTLRFEWHGENGQYTHSFIP